MDIKQMSLQRTTSDALSSPLTAFSFPPYSVVRMEVYIFALEPVLAQCSVMLAHRTIRIDGNGVYSFVGEGTKNVQNTTGTNSWDFEITAGPESISINAIGEAGKTIYWSLEGFVWHFNSGV